MNIKYYIFMLGFAAFLSTACSKEEPALDPNGGNGGNSDINDPYLVNVVNSTFEEDFVGWEVVRDNAGQKATIEVVEHQGIGDSKCLKIQQWAENGKCYAGVRQTRRNVPHYGTHTLCRYPQRSGMRRMRIQRID